MMFSYHSLPDLEKSIVSETDSEPEPDTPLYICCKDTRYIFYLLFLCMLLLFLVFIAILIVNYYHLT